MSGSVLEGKRILAVDDEEDILTTLEEEMADACPDCIFEKASNYKDALGLLESRMYDVVLLDIMGVRGFDLLDVAVRRGFKVAMLTAHALSPEMLRQSIEKKARAYLSKEKLGHIAPLLENLLKYDFESGLYHAFPYSSTSAGRREKEDPREEATDFGDPHPRERRRASSWYRKAPDPAA